MREREATRAFLEAILNYNKTFSLREERAEMNNAPGKNTHLANSTILLARRSVEFCCVVIDVGQFGLKIDSDHKMKVKRDNVARWFPTTSERSN